MKKSFTKIALVLLSVALLVGSVIGISVSAAEDGQVEILAQNIVYGEKVSIAYAVNASLEDAVNGTVKVSYYWEEDGVATLKPATLLDTTDPKCLYNDGTTDYPVFVTEGVAAKELIKVAFAVAYTGEAAPAEAEYSTYSAVQYLYARLYKDGFVNKTDADGKDYNRKLLYQNLLAYGTQAQLVLDYNADKLASDYTYVYTTSEQIKIGEGKFAFGYGELAITGTVLGEGTIAGWTVTDLNTGAETTSEDVVITLNGAYSIEPIFGVHECVDEDNDHLCDSCGEKCSDCFNENATVDHKCDICGKVVDACVDSDTNGKCDVCGVYTFEGTSVISGSNVTIRNITSTNASFATDAAANTNSSSITVGAPETKLYGANMYLDTPATAANKVLVVNVLNAGGSTPSGSTKVTDNLSDIVFTPDVVVENGNLIVLEFDYYLESLTQAPSNGYPVLWYFDYSGDVADATTNGTYSYNKGNPRLAADSDKKFGFEKQTWVRIRLVCDNENKKLHSFISANGGETWNACATVSDLAGTVENIGFSFNVYNITAVHYFDNITCQKTTAEAYGITLN